MRCGRGLTTIRRSRHASFQLKENEAHLAQVTGELDGIAASVREGEATVQRTAKSYTFHQELRAYLDTLGDCLDAKVGRLRIPMLIFPRH